MTDSKGYYAMLGVPERSGYQEIKRSYRRLARYYHPDRNNSAFAEDMIKRINAAFEVLSDETRRAQYDRSEYEVTEEPGPEPQTYSASVSAGTSRAARASVQESVFADFFNGPAFLDTPKGRFHIIVEPSLCMAFGSCETLAPKVFSVEKNKTVNPKAKVECETCADYDSIYAAAETCPTKAIKIIDRYTGEQLYP
ncbi:MAG: DnaJ domain-containing protein [Nitrososphaera sp.]